MAVPKRRMSRANTRSRRAQWKAEATGLVNVTVASTARTRCRAACSKPRVWALSTSTAAK